MAWTYDPNDLDTSTPSGRLNVVRLLVGDTDTTDQQIQNEEITFSLSQVNDNVYLSASFVANLLSSKYSRLVTTELDGQLTLEYSDLSKSYSNLSRELKQQASSVGASLNISAGGISNSKITNVNSIEDRPLPSFRARQFENTYQED